MSARKILAPGQRVAILREHLIEKVPVSQVCDRHGVNVVNFYNWEKLFFENGAAALERRPNAANVKRQEDASPAKIEVLETKLRQKNSAIQEGNRISAATRGSRTLAHRHFVPQHRTIKGDCIRPLTPLCLDEAKRGVKNMCSNKIRFACTAPLVTSRLWRCSKTGSRRSLMNETASSKKLGNSELKLLPPDLPGSPTILSAIRNLQRILFPSSRKTGLCRDASRAPRRCR
jgi:transposase-like protein